MSIVVGNKIKITAITPKKLNKLIVNIFRFIIKKNTEHVTTNPKNAPLELVNINANNWTINSSHKIIFGGELNFLKLIATTVNDSEINKRPPTAERFW